MDNGNAYYWSCGMVICENKIEDHLFALYTTTFRFPIIIVYSQPQLCDSNIKCQSVSQWMVGNEEEKCQVVHCNFHGAETWIISLE